MGLLEMVISLVFVVVVLKHLPAISKFAEKYFPVLEQHRLTREKKEDEARETLRILAELNEKLAGLVADQASQLKTARSAGWKEGQADLAKIFDQIITGYRTYVDDRAHDVAGLIDPLVTCTGVPSETIDAVSKLHNSMLFMKNHLDEIKQNLAED